MEVQTSINDRAKKNEDKVKSNQGERSTGDVKNSETKRKFKGKCYNNGKKGHMEKDYWLKKGHIKNNVATFKHEDKWDAHTFFTTIEESTFTITTP